MSEDDLLLDQQLCFKLYTASRLIIRRYRPMLEALGITYPQYLVLLVLWEWQRCPPVQCTVKALGQRLLLDSGTLTPLLKRLQSLGIQTRVAHCVFVFPLDHHGIPFQRRCSFRPGRVDLSGPSPLTIDS